MYKLLKYNFEILVFYFSISIFCRFILILEAVLYFLLHYLLDNFSTSYFAD